MQRRGLRPFGTSLRTFVLLCEASNLRQDWGEDPGRSRLRARRLGRRWLQVKPYTSLKPLSIRIIPNPWLASFKPDPNGLETQHQGPKRVKRIGIIGRPSAYRA